MPSGTPKNGINKSWIKKGQKMTEKHKQKISKGQMGHKTSKITKLKISNSLQGHLVSLETRKKISDANRRRKHSAETIEKIRLRSLGRKHSLETREKMSLSQTGLKHKITQGFQKGNKINLGRDCSKFNLAKGEKNNKWKGEKVSYSGLHFWVRRILGKAKKCSECGIDKIPEGKKRWFQWANISHLYKRDFNDWKELCIPCHKKFDKKLSDHSL